MKRILAFLLAFASFGAVLSAPLAASKEGTEVEIIPAHLEISNLLVSLTREELSRIGVVIDDAQYASVTDDADQHPTSDRVVLTKQSLGFLLRITSFLKQFASEDFPYVPLIINGPGLEESNGTEITIVREFEDPRVAVDWKRQLRQPRNNTIKYFLITEKANKRIDGDPETFLVVPRLAPSYMDAYRQVYSSLPTMTASK